MMRLQLVLRKTNYTVAILWPTASAYNAFTDGSTHNF